MTSDELELQCRLSQAARDILRSTYNELAPIIGRERTVFREDNQVIQTEYIRSPAGKFVPMYYKFTLLDGRCAILYTDNFAMFASTWRYHIY